MNPSCILTDAWRAGDADRCTLSATTTRERQYRASLAVRRSRSNGTAASLWTDCQKVGRRASAPILSLSFVRKSGQTMRTNRFAEYNGWVIEASPTIIAAQRLFRSGAVISRDTGERFVFSDLGNRVYRCQAYERGIEWAKHWIDCNYGCARTSGAPDNEAN